MKRMTQEDLNKGIDDINNIISRLNEFTRGREEAIVVTKLQEAGLWLYFKSCMLAKTAYPAEEKQ